MNRREFLHRTGALTTVAGLAGCLGSAGRGSPDESNRTDTTDDPTTTERFSGVQSDHDEPFQTISVGNRENVAFPDNNQPRRVRVWNAAAKTRKIRLELSRDAEVVVDRTIEFGADAYLAVELNEPANYRVTVGLADDEGTSVEFSRSFFDCNDSGTDVGVMADGRVETMSASTAMGCPGPEVADAALSVGDGNCGEEHSASVAFDGEAVRVDGAVRTSTPRSDLELADATYDQEADALTVRVREKETESTEVGTQCVGEVSYEATVDFDHALPASAVVVHESMGKTVEVTRASRK